MREEIPLYLINGFLDSGKTTFIKQIIEGNDAYHNNNTVIIACEDGEIEYDDEWCEKYQIHVEYIKKQEDFTPEYMEKLDSVYMADQYVIEYNSFFDFNNQEFPENMVIYQQITMIDASTFNVMFNNMKQIFKNLVEYSAMVIFNRCNGVKELGKFRRQIRGLSRQSQVVFQDENGNLSTLLDEDLPYDITKDNIVLEDNDYFVWYMEVYDKYEKYFNKTFKMKTYVRDVNDKNFIVGRRVMTCCAQDVQFLGYEVINETSYIPEMDDCILLTFEVTRAYSKIAEEETVMLKAKAVSKLKKEKEKILNMN